MDRIVDVVAPRNTSRAEIVSIYHAYRPSWDNLFQLRGWLRKELLVEECCVCGFIAEPPSAQCPRCWSTELQPVQIRGCGEIFMYTILRRGPLFGSDDNPLPIITAAFPEHSGVRVVGLGSPEDLPRLGIGAKLHIDWTQLTSEPGAGYVPWFRLD
jgi:uncharacterized OB-fold protein